jgi:hypothetical protein
MPRHRPRFAALLLWIVIALLPIRAMASAVMPVMMAGLPAAEAGAPPQDVPVVMPCHAAMADVASDANDDAPAADMTHTCSLCDLCHSSVTVAPRTSVVLPVLHEPHPEAGAPSAIEPRAPDGLFRPPRTLLV